MLDNRQNMIPERWGMNKASLEVLCRSQCGVGGNRSEIPRPTEAAGILGHGTRRKGLGNLCVQIHNSNLKKSAIKK